MVTIIRNPIFPHAIPLVVPATAPTMALKVIRQLILNFKRGRYDLNPIRFALLLINGQGGDFIYNISYDA